MEEFPPNSHNLKLPKAEKPGDRRVRKVVKNKVGHKKKTLGTRFTEAFIGDTSESLVDYAIHHILVPAAKELFADTTKQMADAFKEGVERMLYQGKQPPSRSGSRRGHIPYNRMHQSSTRDRSNDRDEPRGVSRRSYRADQAYRDIVFESKVDADEALSEMEDVLARYESVSVNDFYDHVEMDRHTTVENIGWFDLTDARVKRIRDGWMVDFPPHEPLN